MRGCRSAALAMAAVVVSGSWRTAWAVRPTAEEMARRDRWVSAHFPSGKAGVTAQANESPLARPGLIAWTSLGPVYADKLPTLPLQIAEQKFAHGLFTHAPARVRVRLPAPAKSFSATVGILTNPESQGGSVVFSVDVGEKRVSSPVMHRGEAGAALNVDLGGAQEFVLTAGCAGDGLSSDQGVWGDPQVTLADGTSLFISDLPLHDPLAAPRSADTPPCSFTYGGRHSDELLPTWKMEEERESSNGGKSTRVRSYTDPKTGLVVHQTIVTYANYPTVEWTLTFKNTGTKDTPILEGILPLDTRLKDGGGNSDKCLLHYFVGSPCQPNDHEPLEAKLGPGATQHVNTAGGRPTNSHLPYFNVETGQDGGCIAVIGWSGQWGAQFTNDGEKGLRMTGGQECTSFRLHPGEEVRSPVVVLQFYQGDWIRAQNVWRAWMMEHNVPRHNGKPLEPFIFGCTGNSYPGLKTDAAGELKYFEDYAREKILPDYWNQDAGWYPCGDGWWNTGTWEVDKTRWPNGMREASDWLHAHGAKRITWFEPERAASGSWLTQNHPEWCYGGAGGGLMKIGDPEFRKWITERIDQLITSEGIDFYRQDFNMDPLYSWRAADAEDRQGLTEIRHVEGYLAFWDELIRRHPDLWIDSCASGGRRNDLETLRRAVPILRSDFAGDPTNPDMDASCQQNHIYGISFWMPYHGSGIEQVNKYWTRSLMGPITGFGINTRKPGWDFEQLRKLYAEVRKTKECYLGDYWPLTPYSQATDVWCAFQFDLPEAGRGVVRAFRRKTCTESSITLRLRGLDPQARYALTDLDSGETREMTGRELLDTGLKVTADQPQTAPLFTYSRQP